MRLSIKGSRPGVLGICHRINQINLELMLSDRGGNWPEEHLDSIRSGCGEISAIVLFAGCGAISAEKR